MENIQKTDRPPRATPEKSPRTLKKERQAWIAQNWQIRSTADMAKSLHVTVVCVYKLLQQMGLKRQTHSRPRSYKRRKPSLSVCRRVITLAWEHATDQELGILLRRCRGSIRLIRNDMGFLRKKGVPLGSSWSVSAKLDYNDLRRSLLEDGLTVVDYLALRFLPCSRQNLCRICGEQGIDTAPRNRTPRWYANRWMQPKLADRVWVRKKLKNCTNLSKLAKEFNLNRVTFRQQCRRLGIRVRSFLGRKTKNVRLVCTQCQKKFWRRPADIKRAELRRAKTDQKEVWFCSKFCQGQLLGQRNKREFREAK